MINLYSRLSSFFIFILYSGLIYSQDQVMTIDINCSDALQGTTRCFDFVSTNPVDDLAAIQFSITYDPKVLILVGSPVAGNCLTNLVPANFNTTEAGTVSLLWFDTAVNVPSGCVLFSLCFDFIGNPGECSDITIGQYPVDIDIVSELGNVELVTAPCTACVLASSCTVVPKYCNPSSAGAMDGSITFYAVGGVAPYSYSISGPQSFMDTNIGEGQRITIPNLGLGVYSITIIDAIGCIVTRPVSIADIGQSSFDVKPYLPSCFSRDDGQIEIQNINVVNIPYSIKWNVGFFDQVVAPRLRSGIYSVTVTDANGCETSQTINLTIDTLKLNYEIIDSAFCLGKDATVKFDITGGFPFSGDKYRIRLNNTAPFLSPNSVTITTIKSGNLKFEVQDTAVNYLGNSNPCIIMENINIPYINKTDYNQTILNDVTCLGKMDGHVEVEMSGVGTRYRIIKEYNETLMMNINPGGGIQANVKYINDSLQPGNYYIITQSTPEGCQDTFRFAIKVPTNPLVVSSIVTNATCTGPGSIVITASGGEPSYTYNWNDIGSGTNQRLNLSGGDYVVTVSDNNGCDTVLTLKVIDIGVPSDSAVVLQAISCKDFSDGQVTVTGNVNYSYSWEDENGINKGSSKTISGLSWGTYYVTITANGCSKIDSVFLANPEGLIIADVEEILPSCPGQNFTGSLGITIEGGSPGYTYEWSKMGVGVGTNNSVLPSIQPGTYDVRISDFSNCFIDTTLVLNSQVDFNIALSGIIDVTCNGLENGQATATATLGPINNGRYSFFWSSGEQSQSANFNRNSAFTLPSGENWVFVTDTKCKSDTVFFNVNEPPAITVGSAASGLCSGSCTGQITLTVSGGSSNVTFIPTIWPTISETGNTIFNLCAGIYPFIVEDNNGCQFRDTVVLDNSDSLKVTLNESLSQLLSCKNSVGQLAVDVIGGTPGYIYNWTNNVSQSNNASNLSQGIYNVTVSDASGCTASFSYTLTRPNPIIAVIPQPVTPMCFGGKTCIKVDTVTGGVGNNYTMQINNGIRISIDSCFETFAGEYLVSIYDADGCKSDYPVSIDQPTPIAVDLGEDLELNLGEESPLIESFVISDEAVVSYNWSGVDSILCEDDLCSSIRIEALSDLLLTLTVIDENGCVGSDDKRIFVSDKRNVYIPNIFKPTGNIGNAKFELSVGFGVLLVNELIIYDRWGNIVYSNYNYTPDESTGWDGTTNGQQMLPGVYVFTSTVSFIDGQTRIYKGDVTLIK